MNYSELENRIHKQSALFLTLYTKKPFALVTAESLTGGLISAALVQPGGASAYVDCAFTTYSNEAKMHCLKVSAETLHNFGAVSAQTVREMANGALDNAPLADYAVAVSGIAGPTGGSPQKPVGTVWMAFKNKNNHNDYCYCFNFSGSRDEIRLKTTLTALEGLYTLIESGKPAFSTIEPLTILCN